MAKTAKPVMGPSMAFAIAVAATAAIAVGDVVRVGKRWGVAFTDIALNDTGTVNTLGVYEVPKTSGDVLTVGQAVGWDPVNKKVVTDLGSGKLGHVWEAAGSGTTTVKVDLNADDGGLAYSAIAASAAISNTTTPTKFDKQTTIPANTLRVGDVIRIRYQAIATATNSTDTLGLKVFVGAVEVQAVLAVDVADGNVGVGDVDVVVRTIGASGTCVAAGSGGIGATGVATMKATFKASQTMDTTADQAVAVEATWSVASSSNSCRLDILDVQVLRKE